MEVDALNAANATSTLEIVAHADSAPAQPQSESLTADGPEQGVEHVAHASGSAQAADMASGETRQQHLPLAGDAARQDDADFSLGFVMAEGAAAAAEPEAGADAEPIAAEEKPEDALDAGDVATVEGLSADIAVCCVYVCGNLSF